MSETSNSPGPASAEQIGAARRWLVLVIVSLAFFMVELDITVVNVALPSIKDELGFSAADLQWVINAYLLFFGGFLLLAGRFADLIGRKPMFMAGIATFGLGSAIAAVAPSASAIVIGRALQGLGGAMLSPTGLSILTTTFTDTRERTRALAVWTFIMTGSVALGLVLGGVITDTLSWRWVFIINIPVAVLVLLAAPGLLLRMRGEGVGRGFDLAGAVAITAGPALLVYALSSAPAWGWGSPRTVALLVAAAILLAGLVPIELRSRSPLIRLGIFRTRTLTVGNASFFLASSGLFAMFFFSTLYVQDILGWRPLTAGVALLPLAAGIVVGVTAAQQLIHSLGARTIGTGGLVVGVAGTGLLTQIPAAGAYVWPFLPGLFLAALGVGLSMVSLTLLATAVPEEDAGLASGLYTAVSYVGGALGLAVLSTIAATRTADILAAAGSSDARQAAVVSGYQAAYLAAAILLGAAAALIVIFIRRRHLAALETSTPEETPDVNDRGRLGE